MQNSTLAVKKSLKTLLTTITSSYYYEIVPDDAAYPYIVGTLPSSFSDGANTETYIAEVDVWDSAQGTTILETMVQSVVTALDKKVVIDTDIVLRYELDNKLMITDPDVRIRRRKLTFTVKVIQRR